MPARDVCVLPMPDLEIRRSPGGLPHDHCRLLIRTQHYIELDGLSRPPDSSHCRLRCADVVVKAKNAIEPRYTKALTHLAGRAGHVEITSGLRNLVQAGDASPDSGAVDMRQFRHVDYELPVALRDQVRDQRLELLTLGSEHETAGKRN